MYTCLGFLFSQPQTYIRIILRAITNDASECNLMQRFFTSILWPEIEFTLVHLSFEEAIVLVHRWVLWPKSFIIFIMLMNWRTLQPTSFSSWWVSRILGSTHQLVSHVLKAVHWKEEIVTTEQIQLCIGVRVQL